MSDEFEKLLREGLNQLTEGRISESRDTFLKVIRHSSEIGDRRSLADASSGLAEAESDIGNLTAAEHIYSNAAGLYRELGDSQKLARALHQQATLLRALGKASEADAAEREALSPSMERGA
jgi:tetratricopeptide (TPR) repeat protein